jgi:hypothetical protein
VSGVRVCRERCEWCVVSGVRVCRERCEWCVVSGVRECKCAHTAAGWGSSVQVGEKEEVA